MITIETYYQAMLDLLEKIKQDFDCIVALKRSGWIMGVYLSNQTAKPLFAYSEIKSLPNHFKKVLVVDDKICKGKAIRKAQNKLKAQGKITYSACLFVEGRVFPDYHSVFLDGKIVRMWYEEKELNSS